VQGGSETRRRLIAAAAVGAIAGVSVTLLALRGCGIPRSFEAGLAGSPPSERGAELGPDDSRIAEIRVTLETGTANGAGSDNPALLWIDNRRYKVTAEAAHTLAPGTTSTATLMGPGLPRTLGDLRNASIVLTLHLDRAEIGASWYCERSAIEVRLEGAEDFHVYLEARSIGWLSQDEPPRRSTSYALQ
jgi:hypothetical protein